MAQFNAANNAKGTVASTDNNYNVIAPGPGNKSLV
jgi:hypothetical protein